MRQPSLKWVLVSRLVTLQACIIAIIPLMITAVLWSTGYLLNDYEGASIDVLAEAVERGVTGGLMLRETPALGSLRANEPDLWFAIRDREGHRLQEGNIPPAYLPAIAMLDQLSDARLSKQPELAGKPDAVIKWVDSPAGRVQILTGTKGQMSLQRLVRTMSRGLVSLILPVIVLVALTTSLATPLVVRRALAGLRRIVQQAAHIEFDKRGTQLQANDVPIEINALVGAVNDALRRLDVGYERHQHFLAQAAHELRTPIAILNARISALPAGSDRRNLLEDAARLTTLAGQLLDLQRLDQKRDHFLPVNLTAIAKQVLFDLGPLALGAGYEVSFEPEVDEVLVIGDHTSLERALTNLVQNAIDHGGRQGRISVRVSKEHFVDVSDEGKGVAWDAREQIFEPFNRLGPDGRGAGLGLNLVREIMELHGGTVAVVNAGSKGACVRMTFPCEGIADGGAQSA
ncbi:MULTISPECIES: sensor histidine kinase [Rhizobium]|uniref:histidine kinase n=1 Tax=Rhizobium tropici TaxID=398 RepID=A0A6P1CEU0_RHITR|nr:MULTISPECIES: HAMP domain-containing sensor histidine kinase [Rhizobium]AGB73820.1 two-component sensor kinase [Rhizobium tropici CIAT 899]MBB4244937.1 signal transduction histidine kinase [Rhizobium tropici]MBB5595841.1 signal transduction histidine kinase [Rhizobium tropici]MBB6495318.1 signal transduction histidine kinase [Rhizobium tropici]NEV14273.1 HAMP domain-containing histidine kinase [Rhizobium tropici]